MSLSFVTRLRPDAAVLTFVLPLALAGCASSSAGASSDGGTDDGAATKTVAEAGVDCGANEPVCQAGLCQTGVICNYAMPGGGCGLCTCGGYGNGSSGWTCTAGTNGCPLTMPANETACGPLASGLPQGGISCFYPQDAGSTMHGSCSGNATIFCNCVGDPLTQDAGVWVCGNTTCDDDAGSGEAGAGDAADAGGD